MGAGAAMTNLSKLLAMVRYDLRQRLTDGSVLAFAVVVPLALMWVMDVVFSDATDVELQPITVAVATPADDQLAAVIPEVLRAVSADGELQIEVREVTPTEVPDLVADGS